jgi:hypothetical protein
VKTPKLKRLLKLKRIRAGQFIDLYDRISGDWLGLGAVLRASNKAVALYIVQGIHDEIDNPTIQKGTGQPQRKPSKAMIHGTRRSKPDASL